MDMINSYGFSSMIMTKILSLSPHSVIFPFYHAISDQSCPHLKNLYRVCGVKEFEKNIDELLRYMKPMSAEDAINTFKRKTLEKPCFHLSFDDGLREAKEVIAPILLKKGISATFFITPGFTNNKTLFHRHKASLIVEKLKTSNSKTVPVQIGSLLNISKVDIGSLQKAVLTKNVQTSNVLEKIAEFLELDFDTFLKNEQPYLNAHEINELDNNGFSIGLHSLNHPEFHLLDEPGMEYQVTESKRLLAQLTGLESNLFSFPFTDSGIPDRVIKKINEEYKMITFGTAGIKDEPLSGHFQRVPMDAWRSGSAIRLISNEIMNYHLKFFSGRQKVKR